MNYKLIVLVYSISVLTSSSSVNANTINIPDAPTGPAIQSFCTLDSPSLADLVATGSNIQWYESEISAVPLNTNISLISGEDYFATQTVAGFESTERLSVIVFIGDPAPPSGTSPQEFCSANNPTIGDIIITGTNIKWYETLGSSSLISPTTPLVNGEDYFATQTVSGCESVVRFQLNVSIIDAPSPSANGLQEFCAIDNPTVLDLAATGSSLTWYDELSDNTPLPLTDSLTNGEDYFVAQIVNGCESSVQIEVLVSINDVPKPIGNITQTFCIVDNPTVANLQANGTGIVWYENSTSTIVLSDTETLVDGQDYFATQTIDGCESDERLEVIIDIEDTPEPNTISINQEFCGINNPTLNDIAISGSNITWYEDALATIPLDPSSVLIDGEDYFATQTTGSCESANRIKINVAIYDVAAPNTININQTFCQIDQATVADLAATGSNSYIAWYEDASSTVPLSPITPLVDGENYFGADSINGCEGTLRLQVDVSIENPVAPTTINSTQILCSINNPTIADLQVTGTGITWYEDASSTTPLAATTPLVDGGDYFATQTIGSCESDLRIQVNVLILSPLTPTTINANPIFCVADNPTLADISVTGSNIQWYSDQTMINLLAPSTPLVDSDEYFVVQSINGCISELPLEIIPTIEDVPPPTTNTNVQSFCEDQTPTLADLEITSIGTSIQWYNDINGTTLLPLGTPLVDGESYFATQIDGGCESSQSLEIIVDISNTSISAVSFTPKNCFNIDDGNISIEMTGITGNITYDIGNGVSPLISSDNLVTFDNLGAGDYTITVTDEFMCEMIYPNTITIIQADTLQADIVSIDPSSVASTDGMICISPQGGQAPYTVTADCGVVIAGPGNCGGDFYIENLGALSCNLQIEDFNGCIIDEISLLQSPACDNFELSSVIPESPFCNGESTGSIEISILGGATPYRYSLDGGLSFVSENSGNFIFENLNVGNYDILVMDAMGCSVSSPQLIEVTGPSALIADLSDIVNDCSNTGAGIITLLVSGGTPDYTFAWSDGTTTAINENLTAGDYTITVTDTHGCSVIGTTSIDNLQGFDLDIEADGIIDNEVIINIGETVELSVITNATNPIYEWIPSTGLSSNTTATVLASPTETTEYVVSVIDEFGCILSTSILVNVNFNDNIVIPNTFSPNYDGNNDTFYPIIDGTVQITEFKIYNRWGELIHDIPSTPWNGTYKGKDQLVDTYVYVINYETASNPSNSISGDILLVR